MFALRWFSGGFGFEKPLSGQLFEKQFDMVTSWVLLGREDTPEPTHRWPAQSVQMSKS